MLRVPVWPRRRGRENKRKASPVGLASVHLGDPKGQTPVYSGGLSPQAASGRTEVALFCLSEDLTARIVHAEGKE